MSKNFDHSDLSQLVTEHLTSAILILDDQLRVLYLNPAAENLLESSLHRMQDATIGSILSEEESSEEIFKQSLVDQRPYTKREVQVRILGNGTITIDYTITPVNSPKLGSVLLLEIQKLDRLIRISKDEALVSTHHATKALIRGVAHEVKNPLGGIRGAAQLLQKQLPDEDLLDYTQVIIEETDRLRNLVDNMLGPRKIPNFEAVNVHEVLERVKSLVEAERGDSIEIVRDYDPSLPDLNADKDQLIQATLNIARNAAQALLEKHNSGEEKSLSDSDDQTSPQIKLQTRALRQFTIGSNRYKLAIRINVEDNGPGIPPELMESLFYPLVSGRATGTGLGLSIAQSIVQQHKGIIECESEPGKTLFSIIIPLESQT